LGSFKSDVEKLFVVKKDISKAVSYYTKARNMKLARASNNLGVLYTNLKLEKLQEKDEKS
jgi:TPR repeat protein